MTGVEITAKLAWSQRCDHCEGLITTEKCQQCIMRRGEEGEEGTKTVSIMSHSFPPGINTLLVSNQTPSWPANTDLLKFNNTNIMTVNEHKFSLAEALWLS